MNEYTPTTEEVRESFASGVNFESRTPFLSGRKQFDRWLAAHDAEVRAGGDYYEGFEEGTNLGRSEVRESVATEEPEWEYSVVHVQVDGWVERELHLNRQEALDDYGTCGMNCTLMRRRKAGPWEPVEN